MHRPRKKEQIFVFYSLSHIMIYSTSAAADSTALAQARGTGQGPGGRATRANPSTCRIHHLMNLSLKRRNANEKKILFSI